MWWKRNGAGELRRLVMESWDPIGVSGVPQAVDEYDSCLGPIAQRLREGASPEQIADYLATVRGSMGLVPDGRANLHASKRIAEWYLLSTNGFVKPS
jgi:hypothetical protein